MGKLKKVTGYFTRGLPFGARLRDMVYRAEDSAEIYDAVRRYFELLEKQDLRSGFGRVFPDPEPRYEPGDSRALPPRT